MSEFDYEDYMEQSTETQINSSFMVEAAILTDSYVEMFEIKKRHESATGYILVLCSLCAICFSLFVVILICRFKKLRTRTNMFILNISILNIVHTLGVAILILLKNLDIGHVSQIFLYFQTAVTSLYTVFSFFLALDWFISAWKPHWMPKSKKFDYGFILGVYLVFVLEMLIGIFIYYSKFVSNRLIIFLVTYNIILVVMLTLNVFRGLVEFQKEVSKNDHAFSVASVIIFSFVPSLFHTFSLSLVYSEHAAGHFFFFTIFIPYLFWIGHPIAAFFIIRHKDKHFKIACTQFFTCSKNYSDQGFVDFSCSEEESQVNV